MNRTTLELRSIDQLVDYAFLIPSYQRGYRWSSLEVRALLDDLEEFRKAKREESKRLSKGEGRDPRSSHGNFYCLQPVVVLPRDETSDGCECWELIDGQQRLTTIFLIIKYLEALGERVRGSYSLEYVTRQGRYLKTLDPNLQWEDPDSYYMHQAYETIKEWFSEKGHYAAKGIFDILLLPDDQSDFNTKVIWYELPAANPEAQSEIDAFIRLNAGKIRLTNAELIRALFLKARNFDLALRDLPQIKLAQEWDRIEKRLQDDQFWYFLHGGPSSHVTRIDHLFRIHLASTQPELLETIPRHSEFRTFLGYQALDNPNHPLSTVQWKGVRDLAMRLEEWYEDRVLYHLVGFWVALRAAEGLENADVLVDLLQTRQKKRHLDFERELKADIFSQLIRSDNLEKLDRSKVEELIEERLEGLSYGSKRVREILLLFNIATLLRNPTSTARFPFDLFSRQQWDIEHIRPVESRRPRRVPDQKAWLAVVIEYWTGVPASSLVPDDSDDLKRRKQAMKTAVSRREVWNVLGIATDSELDHIDERARDAPSANSKDGEIAHLTKRAWSLLAEERFTSDVQARFNGLYDDVLQHFGEKEAIEADDQIGNLTLLDASTNRRFGNAPFPVKRKHVLGHDRTGTFVPRCTTNVFLKYYSRRPEHLMTWTEDCAHSHESAIRESLVAFFMVDDHRP